MKKEMERLAAKMPKKQRKAMNDARRIPTAPPTVEMRDRRRRREKQREKEEIRRWWA